MRAIIKRILPAPTRCLRLAVCVAIVLPAGAAAQELYNPDAVCPLPDARVKQAREAFGALMPLFMHDRCRNCHGGVNPFDCVADSTTSTNCFKVLKVREHPAMSFNIVIAQTGPNAGQEDVGETFGQCAACHSEIDPGPWRLAPVNFPDRNMQFAGKNSLQLCRQMKEVFQDDPDRFVRHMTNDEGKTPFLATAYAGTLALNDTGKEEAKKHNFPIPAPSPSAIMSREQAVQHAQDWLNAMDDEFYSPEDCGCVELHYGLQVHFKGIWANSVGGVSVNFDWGNPAPGAPVPTIPLHFNDDGSITADATLLYAQSTGSVFAGMGSCAVAGRQTIELTANGTWEKAAAMGSQGQLNIMLRAGPVAANGTATCEALGHVGSGTSHQPGSGSYTFKFLLAPVVGVTQIAPWNVPLPGFSGVAEVRLVSMP
jgi:hypothetical protein